MNTWSRISGWKGTLIIAGLVILAVSMWYTNYLAQKLSQGERDKVDLFVRAHKEIANSEDLNEDITFYTDIILRAGDIPVILTDLKDNIQEGLYGALRDTTMESMQVELARMKKDGPDPIEVIGPSSSYRIYYKGSRLLSLLTYFPLVQLMLLAAFIALGFVGISSAKRAEQNRVWVGMAKETAHQLGTPISAILAWIEHLKETATNDQGEIIQELRNDVERLEMVADRFSKIGSAPKLEPVNIYDELEKTKIYMAKRASRRIQFDFPSSDNGALAVNVNPHLFNWVVENILRNALDAMDGTGTISARVTDDRGYVSVDISDTGKGIPSSKLKTVFQPGYTTKKRGWGLGLSLAKRIIENYHAGKIFVKQSKVGEGTTFSIKLPKV